MSVVLPEDKLVLRPGYYEWSIWKNDDDTLLYSIGDLSESIQLEEISTKEELTDFCRDIIEVWKEDWAQKGRIFYFLNDEVEGLINNMVNVLNNHYGIFENE